MYDVVVIGGGPTGISAAIYAYRFGLDTIVIVKERGGLITKTHLVENYPGFPSVTGLELMQHFEDHMNYFKIPMVDDEVTEVRKVNDHFIVKTPLKEYKTKTIIIATGTKVKKLGIPGEKEYNGKGVSYCATCDAAFFKKKTVGMAGGSDSAAKEALLLSEHCKKVYIIYRGEKIHPEPINLKRVESKDNIEIINFTNVKEIKGDGKAMNKIILDKSYNGKNELELGGLFIAIGHIPLNELAKQLGCNIDDHGLIVIDNQSKTNVDGVYAAGDVANRGYKQAITGAAEGVMAAFSAYEYISKGKVSY